MITIHLISKSSSESFSRTIDPKTQEEFQDEISELETKGKEMFGKFYFDFDTFNSTDEQEEWVTQERF